MTELIHIIGGGMAGSGAAWQAANARIESNQHRTIELAERQLTVAERNAAAMERIAEALERRGG